jgi:hypothetical protein
MSAEPAAIGRHGRLSPDYVQASLSLLEDQPRAVGAAGRLQAEYQQAVAEVVNNAAAFFRVVLDERFDGSDGPSWPNDPEAEIRRVEGGLRLRPMIGDHWLAVGAPVGPALRDVLVGARFRKLGDQADGTYGLLLRDGGPGPRDGRHQTGRYYVAQVSDQGMVGIWRRDGESWLELVAWTPCAKLRSGQATNDLSFEVVGGRLTLMVNGQTAASANDALLDHGGVGLVVGGAGNAMLVERFVVHALG